MKQKRLLANLTIFRGAVALLLGFLLLIQPESSRFYAINFMGVYWLLGGIVSLRVAKSAPRAKGFRIASGIIGIVAGVALLSRTISVSFLTLTILLSALGVLILFSGILHILAGLRFSEAIGQGWKVANVLLGLFEAVFGVMLLLIPWVRFDLAYLSLVAWAILGGIIMLGDGLRVRRLLQRQQLMSDKSS